MTNNTTPYGYRLENGKAVIQEEEANRLREMNRLYLSGLSFAEAANRVGLTKRHGAVGKLFRNRKYLGTDFYPAILDQETFDAVEEERKRREKQLSRSHSKRRSSGAKPITAFKVPRVEIRYSDPARQAEYAYSLIEVK